MRGDWRGVDPASMEAGAQVESPCLGPFTHLNVCTTTLHESGGERAFARFSSSRMMSLKNPFPPQDIRGGLVAEVQASAHSRIKQIAHPMPSLPTLHPNR